MEDKHFVPIEHKMLLTIQEMAQYSNIGERSLRKLLLKPECRPLTLNVGRKVLIKRSAFEDWINTRAFIE